MHACIWPSPLRKCSQKKKGPLTERRAGDTSPSEGKKEHTLLSSSWKGHEGTSSRLLPSPRTLLGCRLLFQIPLHLSLEVVPLHLLCRSETAEHASRGEDEKGANVRHRRYTAAEVLRSASFSLSESLPFAVGKRGGGRQPWPSAGKENCESTLRTYRVHTEQSCDENQLPLQSEEPKKPSSRLQRKVRGAGSIFFVSFQALLPRHSRARVTLSAGEVVYPQGCLIYNQMHVAASIWETCADYEEVDYRYCCT